MKHTETWYGNMVHLEDPLMVIVHSIEEKSIMNPLDADEYMLSQGYDSYLIPAEYSGEIVFSQAFFKGLAA